MIQGSGSESGTSDEEENTKVESQEEAEELSGKLGLQNIDEKLMHSVLENDKETIDNGKLINDSLNQGFSAFSPDLMFEQLVQNYKMAKQIYGESILRLLSGYNPGYMEKNINVPEFQKEIKKRVEEKISNLKNQGLIDSDGFFTDKGYDLASIVLYVTELDDLEAKGEMGEKYNKKVSSTGDVIAWKNFNKNDKYSDIDIKKSVKTAIRRNHKNLELTDLKSVQRHAKGDIEIIYALDASGSMKGQKIEASKRAGVALAYKATSAKDKVGLLVFGSEIIKEIYPTRDFSQLANSMSKITPKKETDFEKTIENSIRMFSDNNATKHLILLTDAMPTVGEKPEEETLLAVEKARDRGITISLVGIKLNEHGLELAKKITELGKGKLYLVKDLDKLDQLILEDYYSL